MHQTSQDLSKSAQTLQSVLGGAKTRGTLGEVRWNGLLQDALPQSAYETQYRFDSTGAIVDAIVRSGERILSIDSKFPLEAYRRLVETGEEARRGFLRWRSANTPIPSRKNIFCRTSTRSITR